MSKNGDTEQATNIAQLVTDEYGAKILIATYHKPKSAIELSQKLAIPIAACYRRIHALEKAGLLECVGVVDGLKGKKMRLYKSRLEKVLIYFEKGKMRVRLIYSDGYVEDLPFARPPRRVARDATGP